MPRTSDSISRRTVLRIGAGAASAALGGSAEVHAILLSSQRLEIAGNQFLADGKPVRLLGVAVGDPLYVRANRSIEDYGVIANDWRANVVRISLHPYQWRNLREESLLALNRDITAARAQGLWVILDWHAVSFPGAFYDKPEPDWGMPEDAFKSDPETAAEFWRAMAQRFGSDPGMIFELWNEPVIDPRTDASTRLDWPRLKALWLELIGVIRQHSEAIVLASGARFAHDLKGVRHDLIADPRVAYAWHCYPNEDRTKPDRWHVSLDGLPRVKPVVVTEWGFCTDCQGGLERTPDNFGKPFVKTVLDHHGLHSTTWCWSPGAAPQMLR